MSIRFVFGPAGSGKSTLVERELIEESIKNPKENFLLIVPDQFTMQTQMDIVKLHPNKGILNIDVLSFGRLSYRVFSVTGKSELPVLDDTGKSLVLRRVAGKVKDRMPFLGRNLNKIGYIHEVKSQISEFMQYGLSVKDVEKLSEKLPESPLKRKLSDLSIIYEAFMDINKERFITNEETLDILCDKLSEADFIKGSTIVFDGFTGFTPIQEKVVLRLCELAKRVTVTFNLSNPESPLDTGGEEKLFYLSRKGANRLKTFAGDRGIEIEEDTVIDGNVGRLSNNPELLHLEKNLFRFPYTQYTEKPERIKLFSTGSIEEEVSQIALEIHKLIETGDYAYRDIAVVCGNLDAYGMSFENRMRELSMPVFIDRTNQIVLNPFIEYLKSALKIVLKDYSYDSVFHYLRSGFTDFEAEKVDAFDRYVTSLNIRGKSAYHKEFKKFERGLRDKDKAKIELEEHEKLRESLVQEIDILECEGKTAGDYVRALYELLTKNNSYEKLLELEAFFEAENNLSKAKEYGQIYKLVMELLDTIDSLIGTEEMDLEEFYRIFEAGIGEIEVGTIPKNVDRVVVGDIERTRVSQVKVLFLAGVNDGNIPKLSDKGGILSMMERETLSEAGFELAPTKRQEMYTQRLYLYMNMCKPSDRLFISYAGADAEGKGMRPSYLCEVLTKIFTRLTVENISPDMSKERVITLKDSLRHYAGLLRDYAGGELNEEKKALAKALLTTYMESEATGYEDINQAAFEKYVATPLSKEIVKLIYGETIRASISRMELYAGCAYAHFLKYGMELKENAEASFEARDLGSVYHGVLDLFATKLDRRGLTFADFSEEEGKELIAEAVKEYCEEYEQGLLKEDEQSAYTIEKITKIMERTVETLKYHLLSGRFKTLGHEYSFEREIELLNGETMRLNGKIDRIDLYETDGKIYVKILDFKSGKKDIDITDIYHGVQQQLAVYMAEAVHRERARHPEAKVIPSALMYYTIDNPMVTSKEPITQEALETEIKKELRVKGLFENSLENIEGLDKNVAGDGLVLPLKIKKDGDLDSNSKKRAATTEEFENLLSYVERLIQSIGTRITDGDKAINPMCGDSTDACRFCNFRAACRFDEKIPGFKARDGKEKTSEEAREIVMGGESDGLYLFD